MSVFSVPFCSKSSTFHKKMWEGIEISADIHTHLCLFRNVLFQRFDSTDSSIRCKSVKLWLQIATPTLLALISVLSMHTISKASVTNQRNFYSTSPQMVWKKPMSKFVPLRSYPRSLSTDYLLFYNSLIYTMQPTYHLTYTQAGDPVHCFVPCPPPGWIWDTPSYWETQEVKQFIVHLRFREVWVLYWDTKTNKKSIWTKRFNVRESLHQNSLERFLEKNSHLLIPNKNLTCVPSTP